MSPSFPFRLTCLLFVVFGSGFAGCVQFPPVVDETRFYVLSAPASERTAEGPLDLYLRTIELPDYLDRPRIAVRSSTHEVRYESMHRWAGNLDGLLAQALLEGLIESHPEIRASASYGSRALHRLDLRVLSLEGLAGGAVSVSFDWRLETVADGTILRGRWTQRGQWTEGDYASLVAELSRLLAVAAADLGSRLPPTAD